jgi:iron(III) transport system substrate-binding protein
MKAILNATFFLRTMGFVFLLAGCSKPAPRVVLCCAQDKEFAEQILDIFSQENGLPVAAKYDTEANKSVSLYMELVQEKSRPRCDVYWNNEILSTIRLQQQGLLEPYASPSAEPFPGFAKAKDQTWTAFGERARVLLINTSLVPKKDWPQSILDLTLPTWKGKVGMAKPQFGTTATQAACLFEVLGMEEAKQFYLGLKKNKVQIVAGNKQAAEGVSLGQFSVGLTDTDDALLEIQAGHPVTMLFPDGRRQQPDRMGTLFIPNTVAIIKGCRNPTGARRLVDYLLRPEVETKLAEGGSHQIPLNPHVQAQLPQQMETRKTIKAMDVDFEKAAALWTEVQKFLENEFARP